MKFFLTLICCISLSIGHAQSLHKDGKSFVLNGIINGCDTGHVILVYTNFMGKWTRDTTYLRNGRFRFEGKISEPTLASVSGYRPKIIDFNQVNYVSIFLEPTVQTIALNKDYYTHAKMSGSATQKEFDTFNKHIDTINAKYKSINQQLIIAKYAYENAKTQKGKESALREENMLIRKLVPRSNEIMHEDISFLLHYPDSYVSPFIFYSPANSLPLDSAESLFNTLTLKIQNSISGRDIAELLRKRKENAIGEMPYNFEATQTNGRSISLSNLRGKYVLLDFWASWCGPCRAEMPFIEKLYNIYHHKGLEIVTISIDKDSAKWKEAVIKEKINNWYNILVNEGIKDNYENVYQPIPSEMLIAPDGKIIWKSNENETLKEALRRCLE